MASVNALILDLGGVVFNWKAPKDAKVSPKELHRAMTGLPWHEFERGEISEQECFDRVANLQNLSASDIKDAIQIAVKSLEVDNDFLSTIKKIKTANAHRSLRVYAMSNIVEPHYQILRAKLADWSVFDEVFTSADVGKRKPELGFYRHVLEKIGLAKSPSSAILVDDTLNNVISAKSLGMQAVQFHTAEETIRRLLNVLGNPVARGSEYLDKNAKNMHSAINGLTMKENFAQLLILEATGNRDLVVLKPPEDSIIWNFFSGKAYTI
ncbi:hypothetical protein ABW20_dc0105627 [Dactylellina cionopaga]|nr:hypothetical protein ABW20_dc0105627 [Dactylellina cionopaga]